jgi:hypothetical protein
VTRPIWSRTTCGIVSGKSQPKINGSGSFEKIEGVGVFAVFAIVGFDAIDYWEDQARHADQERNHEEKMADAEKESDHGDENGGNDCQQNG